MDIGKNESVYNSSRIRHKMTDFSISIHLNHSDSCNDQDIIRIYVNPCHTSPESIEFSISYTQKSNKQTMRVYNKSALFKYLDGLSHFLQIDKTPFYSVDLIVTCYPSIKFKPAEFASVLPTIHQAIHLFV